MKKIILLVLPFIFACSNNITNISNKNILESKNTLLKKKVNISINLNSLNIKASENGLPFVTSANVKSYGAFLTSNNSNPFESGANPEGDNEIYYFNNLGDSTVITLNVPANNEPYYAVIAAFDKVSDDSTKKNISEPNSLLTSPTLDQKKWYVSNNNVKVNNLLETVFLPQPAETLQVTLKLANNTPARIQTEMNIVDGNATVQPFTAQ